MLGFQPTDKVIFKIHDEEVSLSAIYDSQDWNPNEEKTAVFQFSKTIKAETNA